MEAQEQNKVDAEMKKWVKGLLKSEIVTLTFTKKDGTERVMKATLKEEFLPADTEGWTANDTRKHNEDALAVWDTESQGWRAFRWDSLKSVAVTLQ